ncbi:hypothetical protein [Thermogemmata fonticola]|uniref:Uncharacterized protein n=1 Tax=Thermogemmata fonticola TaxID=2755323 RepID=A0A7V9ACT4_9BACT|nr:hypothetical protein [Thermogemmata fonticola]MBA2227523.1 hypothetical protein [Thermogemmata fonticola]
MGRRLSPVLAQRASRWRGASGAAEPFWETERKYGEQAKAGRWAAGSAPGACVPAAALAAAILAAAAAIAAGGS